MSTQRPVHPLLRGALGVAAVVQVLCAGRWLVARVPRIPQDIAAATAAEPPGELSEGMRAFRALPDLLRAVPLDAPVLVVSTLAAVQLEYYVLPRPMRLLQAIPDQWLRLAEEHLPQIAPEVRRRRERLDARGALLDAERLATAIDEVRFVLIAGPPPDELAPLRARLVLHGERPWFTLYAVR